MRAGENDNIHHEHHVTFQVNICGAITYVAFLVVYIYAFIASKKVTDEEDHQQSPNDAVQ